MFNSPPSYPATGWGPRGMTGPPPRGWHLYPPRDETAVEANAAVEFFAAEAVPPWPLLVRVGVTKESCRSEELFQLRDS